MKTTRRIRLAWSASVAVLTLGATALLAAAFGEETPVTDRFDQGIYNAALVRHVASVADIAADYEWQQLLALPIAPPDPAIPFTMPGGTLPIEPKGFSDAFLADLIPAVRNGIVVYPITVHEDPQTQARVILNTAGQELARVAAPGDYDPLWYVEAHTPSIAAMEPAAADWHTGVYDPSRIAITYDLILEDALVQQVWQMSLLSETPPPPEGECEDCEGEGTNAPLSDWSGVVTNLKFVQIGRLESGLVVRVTLGIPDGFTNNVSVFTCTNLVTTYWSHLFTTNAPTTTNTIIFTDDTFNTDNERRFYNAICFAGSLHPQAADFESGKAGRVMISTLHDEHYYTATPTTKADEPAQTDDAKVTITAHLPTSFAGESVYFRVVSPDPDDSSPFEADSEGGDNRDTNIVAGLLSATNDMAELETINGAEVAAAEVELTITDQYAGDNYKVEYSLDSDFARVLDQTVVMVAWKRMYIEIDRMYRSSADLATDFTPDTNSLPDSIAVVSRSYGGSLDISVGDAVRVCDAVNPSGEMATVTNIVDMTLYLDTDLTNSYNAGYGAGDQGAAVAVPDPDNDEDIDVYEPEVELFATNAFGCATDGTDGGCFVEFIKVESGSTPVPFRWSMNYYSGWATPWTTYVPIWFNNRQKPNFLYVLSGDGMGWQFVYGFNYGTEKASIILVGNIEAAIPSGSCQTFNGETVVHELGHTWASAPMDGNHPHNALAHDDSDYCIMDYGPSGQLETIFANGKTEFCISGPNHLFEVRENADGL